VFGIVRAGKVRRPNKVAVQLVDGGGPVIRANRYVCGVFERRRRGLHVGRKDRLCRLGTTGHVYKVVRFRLYKSSKRFGRGRERGDFRRRRKLGACRPVFYLVRPPTVDSLEHDPANVGVVDCAVECGFDLPVSEDDGGRD
jgi:hypothetical protein